MSTVQGHYNSFALKVATSPQPYLLVQSWVLSIDAYFQNTLICFTFFFHDSKIMISISSQSLEIQVLMAQGLSHRPKCLLYMSTEMFHWQLKFNTKPLSSLWNLLFILAFLYKEWHSFLPSYPSWRFGNKRQSSCPWLDKMWQMGTKHYFFVSGNIKSHELQLYTSTSIALKNTVQWYHEIRV